MYETDYWCWEEEEVAVRVGSGDVEGILFEQRGWRMVVEATHPVHTWFMADGAEPFEADVVAGVQSFCLTAPGAWTMMHMYQCVFFGSLMFGYNTNHPEVTDPPPPPG